jgi:membrane protease YdiL (CAAX protease family)
MFNYTSPDLLLVAIAAAVIPLWSAVAGNVIARTPADELRLVPLYWLVIVRGVLVSSVVLFVWHRAGRTYASLGLDFPIGYEGRVGLGLDAVLACYFMLVLPARNRSEDRVASIRRRFQSLRIMPRTRAEFLLYPAVAVAGSIFEELLYRGYLISLLSPAAGVAGAVLLSSALFGLGHVYQGWRHVTRTALIGLSLAFAYAMTRSLWWLMLAHAIFNLSGGLIARTLMQRPVPSDHESAA